MDFTKFSSVSELTPFMEASNTLSSLSEITFRRKSNVLTSDDECSDASKRSIQKAIQSFSALTPITSSSSSSSCLTTPCSSTPITPSSSDQANVVNNTSKEAVSRFSPQSFETNLNSSILTKLKSLNCPQELLAKLVNVQSAESVSAPIKKVNRSAPRRKIQRKPEELKDVNPKPKRKRKEMSQNVRNQACKMCGVHETPEWRRGPDQQKSLCNACGLHYAKIIKRESEVAVSDHRKMSISSLLN